MSVIAVCSGKGSPGATFVAVNLATALSHGNDVLLLDLDPAGGDIAAYLGLDPRRGIFPLLRMDNDIPKPEAIVHEAEERGGLLALSGFPESSPATSPSVLSCLVSRAKQTDRTVVVDIGRITTDSAIVAREADFILIVVRPDLVSVLGAERALRSLKERRVDFSHTAAVISGLERRRPGDIAEVAKAMGISVAGTIPLHHRSARQALIAQKPIQKGRLHKSFRMLAEEVRSRMEPPAEPQPAPQLVEAVG
ncbi:MAG: P-loop NTPase [Actinomycetota bacterium]